MKNSVSIPALPWDKLVFATRLFTEIEAAADDLAALDILRQKTLIAKRKGLFFGVVDAAAFLASADATALLSSEDASAKLDRHGLSREAVISARQKASNFFSRNSS